jgi:hypothetical protein
MIINERVMDFIDTRIIIMNCLDVSNGCLGNLDLKIEIEISGGTGARRDNVGYGNEEY